MLEWILVIAALWFILGVETYNLLERLRRRLALGQAMNTLNKQAGAPRPTTTPASPEGCSAVAFGVSANWLPPELESTNRGSPASPLPSTTLASLQALGKLASLELSHAEHCFACKEQPEVVILRFKTLAQAVVDLASTSASEATSSSVASAQAPATSGSSESSERIKHYPVRTLTGDDDYWLLKANPARTAAVSDLEGEESSERIKHYPVREATDPVLTDGDYGRPMNEY